MNARIALLPLIILACACSAEAPASTVTGPMDVAVTQAAEAGMNVLVLYTKEGCACSAIMDETLADPEVEEALGKTVFLRMTKGLNAETFESRWAEAEAPSFVVLGADGKAKGEPMKGPFEAGEFLFLLDWVATPEGPQPELVRIEDGCGGCGEEETEAESADGCGGCGDDAAKDAAKVVAPETDDGCGGCSGE